MSRITLSDRYAIEAGIYRRQSLKEIAEVIGKSPRYVSEEIRQNRSLVKGFHPLGKDCRNATGCNHKHLCGNAECNRLCRTCVQVNCQSLCSQYNNQPCSVLSKPPYVCNVCSNRRKCKADRAYYIAAQADAAAKKRYSDSRSKPQVRGQKLQELDSLVSPLIQKGQPLTHIYAEHGNDLPVSQRTLYNYIDQGLLDIKNIDLRRKVGYRPRKKAKDPSEAFLNQQFRKSRSYEDFLKYTEKHPDIPYVEMDTVKGVREKGKRVLTLLFVKSNLMLILLMQDCKAESVVEQIDWLCNALGLENFRKLFPLILTDNGSEFKHTKEMEYTAEGKRRTRIFYCDPMASWQKPHVEKNHEFMRYVIPKGKSLNPYTKEDMTLLTNHINSTKRTLLGGRSPYDLAGKEVLEILGPVLGLHPIPADEVRLTPELLKRNSN